MKKNNLLTAAIILATTGISSSVLAVPSVSSYKTTTSAYDEAYISGNFNAQDGNQEQASYQLNLEVDYDKVISSPNRNAEFKLGGIGSVGRDSTAGAGSDSTYSANASANLDNYFRPNSKGAYWYGKGELNAEKDRENIESIATIGLGYGRVTNVTPMAHSIRIVEELRRNGILTGDLTNASYQAIAEIVEKENEYISKFGSKDYEQSWIEDIEKVLVASGKVKGGSKLSARGVLETYDVLVEENIIKRRVGWKVYAGAGAVLSDFDGNSGKTAVEVGADYHRPIGNQTQFSNEALTTAKLKDGDNGYNFTNDMTLSHEITDKVDWINSWNLGHEVSDNYEDITTNTLSSTYSYELTNELDFQVTALLSDTEDNIADNGNDDLDTSLNMGVKYRLK